MVNPVAVAETPRGVLLVEDEFLIRMLLAGHLRESGYMVVEACNGEEAVALSPTSSGCSRTCRW